MHRVVLPNVINHLYEETENNFENDIRSWPVTVADGIPTQTNNYDCGILIWKYMKTVILPQYVKWEELLNWQAKLPNYRSELAFTLLCSTLK
ncbi:hypothetical protein MA16_Dca001624 [Dendrobium catenatum]|uniref:Ubiquitin-like protease family profile domain-containing protein n=1 Tax=Dendrobium catenatum TaxID=906689 RepID=A0A2I0WMZ3_9ASPA|nr:hypothetical protein MA16_Dca001624 [Dendrobium catenatum]